MTSLTCYLDVPVAKRGLGWAWSLAWSRHPRDEAACRQMLKVSTPAAGRTPTKGKRKAVAQR